MADTGRLRFAAAAAAAGAAPVIAAPATAFTDTRCGGGARGGGMECALDRLVELVIKFSFVVWVRRCCSRAPSRPMMDGNAPLSWFFPPSLPCVVAVCCSFRAGLGA